MATAQKISELTTAGPLTGPELVPIVQNGGTVQTFVSTLAIFATSTLSSDIATVSVRLDQVSAATSINAANITSTNAVVAALSNRVANVSASVSTLNAQMTEVQASISAINSVLATIDTSAINTLAAQVSTLEIRVTDVSSAVTSINDVVSALEVRVSTVSAATSANAASITSTNAVVSALDTRVASVSASVSALQIQVDAVSTALTSTNNVVSALEIRVSNASAAIVSANAVIANVSALVSALDIRLTAVSASVSVNAAAITSINAVLSTKVNRVGDFMDAVQYIEFDTSTSFATSVGRLTWDITHGTLDLGLIGGNANLLLGQREVVYCYNNSGATILKGKVVQVTGASGQRLTIDLAQADSDLNSLTVLGVALENVSVNSSGFVATDGVINNVDTSNFADGQIVFLSPVSAGELTATKPVAPQHMVQIGYVVKGGSVGGGSIYAKVQNGYELGELHDVKTSASASIANNEVLAYNTSAGVWTNSTVLLDVQASVSALNVQIASVSANTSALSAQIAAVSALTSVNAAAITSVNAVVSALDTRVGLVSAAVSVNVAAITSINNVLVSILNIINNTNYRVTE